MIRQLALVLLFASLISCRTQVSQPAPAAQPLPAFPLEIYRPTNGRAVYSIDAAHSRADIVVRRGGALARFGHDHVVSAEHIYGYVLLATSDLKSSRADLRLALDSLIVDEPAAREKYALDTQPSAQDIAKTRDNMLGKVLQTDIWPQVHLTVEVTGGTVDTIDALLAVYLHGVEHRFPISFRAEGWETSRLSVSGAFSLHQTDFGMQPFSAFGGGLQVIDQVDVTFLLQADRLDSPAKNP